MIKLPFRASPALVGAVHLQPLPGSPLWESAGRPPLSAVVARAEQDARTYLAAGFDGVIVENFGDAPFFKLPPRETLACMVRCARAVVEVAGEAPVGVNILRNDGEGALAVALAVGARFIRVNVLSGAAVTDQGLIEGTAANLLRLRANLGLGPGGSNPVALMADVHVKHAEPLAGGSLTTAAQDTAKRGLADAVILSGAGTGSAPTPEHLAEAQAAVPRTPLWLGSGLTLETITTLVPYLDGAILGSAAEEGGKAGNPVDPARAEALALAFHAAGNRT